VKTHLEPPNRLGTGQVLASVPEVTAMIDISDGLLQDLGHICKAAGVGSNLDVHCIPLAREYRDLTDTLGINPAAWAMTGGEDYELCWTVKPECEQSVLEMVWASGAVQAATIGRISRETGVRPMINDHVIPVDSKGWDHFRSQESMD
jgi:thiamine-monophosphate kinase